MAYLSMSICTLWNLCKDDYNMETFYVSGCTSWRKKMEKYSTLEELEGLPAWNSNSVEDSDISFALY